MDMPRAQVVAGEQVAVKELCRLLAKQGDEDVCVSSGASAPSHIARIRFDVFMENPCPQRVALTMGCVAYYKVVRDGRFSEKVLIRRLFNGL